MTVVLLLINMDEESLLSPEAMATAAATQELKSLQALHASLRALKEMMKAVNKDYTTLAENYEKLAETNDKWKVLITPEGHSATKQPR